MLSVVTSSVLDGAADQREGGAPAYTGRGFPFWLLPLLASWGYATWLFGQLPASVPVHWNLAGQVDRNGGPLEAAFLLPVILLSIAALMLLVLPRFIPQTPAYAGTHRVYQQLVAAVLCFMLYTQVVTAQLFLGREVHLLSLLTLGAGVLFIFMGNLLPKLRRNTIGGARLPWAMQDDLTWVKTQRVAGLSFVILGLVLVCVAPLPGFIPLAVLLAGKAIAVALVVWYSWNVSQRT